MVVSSKTQFPKYNDFLQGCIDRNKLLHAVAKASKEDVDIFQDDEAMTICNTTNLINTFETQKFNILVIAQCGLIHCPNCREIQLR